MQIQQHEVRPHPADDLDRLLAILDVADDLMTELHRADLAQHLAKHQVIFDNDDPHDVEAGDRAATGLPASRRGKARSSPISQLKLSPSTANPPRVCLKPGDGNSVPV